MSFPSDNKLTLNKEMLHKTWLIQRLQKPFVVRGEGLLDKFKDNPFAFGGGLKNGGLSDNAMDLIRNIFQFDYMGSSEFEWGAVPNALAFLAEQASRDNLTWDITEVGKNELVYFISPIEYKEEVINRIKTLRNNGIRLQEHCGLDTYFDSQSEYAKKNCGWLELDNGFMFFTDEDMFEKTCRLFGLKV